MNRPVVALLCLVLASCVAVQKYDALAGKYKQSQAESAACATEREAAKRSAADLESKAGDLAAERDKGAAAAHDELETRRRQHAEITARLQGMIDGGKVRVGARDGVTIVELPAGVLFAAGKADLSAAGDAAVAEVGKALGELKDQRFLVAGHADDARVAGGRFKDNWELSTARALAVTRALVTHGVAPAQLGAAGYGEFAPAPENDGRGRIEIVLLPAVRTGS